MKNLIIKQLRERSSIKGKQKTWISECSNEQLYQLFQKLRSGESAKSIAHYIQKTWKVNSKSTVHSVSQGILKFRKRISDLLEIKLTEEAIPDLPVSAGRSRGIKDDLLAMHQLVKLQRERIERMMEDERKNGVRYPNLSRDLQSLATLAKVLVKEKEFFLKHGELDPIRQREEEETGQRIERNFQTFIANTTDESRERIVQMTDRFLQLAAEHAVTMIPERDRNGKIRYKLIE